MRYLFDRNLRCSSTGARRRARDGTGSTRTWSLTNGKHLHGTFIEANDRTVKLMTVAGEITTLEISELPQSQRLWVARKRQEINDLNATPKVKLVTQVRGPDESSNKQAPAIASSFKAFEKSVKVRWDNNFLFVESNGIPDHSMMVGIRAWQQQVPLPQSYFGDNAWRIPLHPVPAKNPATAKGRFLRGAIALAVNGIPIFNPLNNRGDDAYLVGELDEFGGHCGRADDYHYHIAPVHLEKTVGKGQPIAYALDGYPILGYQDPKAPDFAPVDWLGGHKDSAGNYHYHATDKYPYINGGFYGEVVERDGQVDPQPRAEPVRPALPPMQGAKITKFEKNGANSVLTYEIQGRPGTVRYTENDNGTVDFVFTDPAGKSKSESYRKRGNTGEGQRRGGRQDGPPRQDPQRNNRPEPRKQTAPPRPDSTRENASVAPTENGKDKISVSSSSVDANGFLSIECTCDGKKHSPAIAWKNVPEGTKSIAVSIWHTAPDQEKSYWLVYNIPANTTSIPQNASGIGTLGLNDKKRNEYDPMCSKGPGTKVYHVTVFALSQTLDIKPNQCDRKQFLTAAKNITLAQGSFDFKYERK